MTFNDDLMTFIRRSKDRRMWIIDFILLSRKAWYVQTWVPNFYYNIFNCQLCCVLFFAYFSQNPGKLNRKMRFIKLFLIWNIFLKQKRVTVCVCVFPITILAKKVFNNSNKKIDGSQPTFICDKFHKSH